MSQNNFDMPAADERLARVIADSALNSIEDVIGVMRGLDDVLQTGDGLKWFNLLYLRVTEGVREDFWRQGMMAGFPASYSGIAAFSETDLTEDLARFDVPTLVLHGDDDQIVPIAASAMHSSKMIRGATLRVYEGAPHGMCTTLKDRVNEELLAFLR